MERRVLGLLVSIKFTPRLSDALECTPTAESALAEVDDQWFVKIYLKKTTRVTGTSGYVFLRWVRVLYQ